VSFGRRRLQTNITTNNTRGHYNKTVTIDGQLSIPGFNDVGSTLELMTSKSIALEDADAALRTVVLQADASLRTDNDALRAQVVALTALVQAESTFVQMHRGSGLLLANNTYLGDITIHNDAEMTRMSPLLDVIEAIVGSLTITGLALLPSLQGTVPARVCFVDSACACGCRW
jgi:hypothetical protein